MSCTISADWLRLGMIACRSVKWAAGAEGMRTDGVIGWIVMLLAALHPHLINAAVSLIPIAVIDMRRSVPPAQIRYSFR